MEQLSFEEAKRLSIKKWEIIVKNDGESCIDLLENDKELVKLRSHCGFCERMSIGYYLLKCEECEFGKISGDCHKNNSYFRIWQLNKNKENAQNILEIIKNLKE